MDPPAILFESFQAAAGRQPGRYGDKPLLTWYDDGRTERVELSYRTFHNWVAKTANLLVEELGAGPGDRVGALLVDHWRTAVVLAACWRAGVGVVALDPDPPGGPPDPSGAGTPPPPSPEGLVAAFVREELLGGAGAAALAAAGTPLVAVTADLFGRGRQDPGRALDYARLVPTMGDHFDAGPDPAGPALAAAGETATMAELLERAAALAGTTGLADSDRLLAGLPLLTVAGAAAGLLAPFLTGAGVVLARPFDPARFWKLVGDERVTVAVLDPDQAAALLAAGRPPAELDRSRLRAVASPGADETLAAGFAASLAVPLLPG